MDELTLAVAGNGTHQSTEEVLLLCTQLLFK